VQYIPYTDGFLGYYMPYGTKEKATASGANNCLYDALACQTDKVKSGAELRAKVADRMEHSKHTAGLYFTVKNLRAHNPSALKEGGDSVTIHLYMPQTTPQKEKT